jgi:hypothetical protein
LGLPPKRSITESKLEDEAIQITGWGVLITGFDDPHVSAICWRYSQNAPRTETSLYHNNKLYEADKLCTWDWEKL